MFAHDRVNVRRGNTRHDNRSHELMGLPDAQAGLAHQRYFSF
jgi:hypothetical protein